MSALLAGSEVFGLPLHALVVHFAVVTVPAAALGLIALGWRPDWRRQYLLPLTALAVLGAVAAVITAASGEALQESVRDAARAAGSRARFGDHPEQGDVARNFAVLLALAAAGFYAVQQWGARWSLPSWSTRAAYLVTSGVAMLATVSIVVAGHSGAALVWKDVGNFVSATR